MVVWQAVYGLSHLPGPRFCCLKSVNLWLFYVACLRKLMRPTPQLKAVHTFRLRTGVVLVWETVLSVSLLIRDGLCLFFLTGCSPSLLARELQQCRESLE